ncbi:MAG TPA: helix-turn-helix domain-containing protein [bacterium]|nr:helix-turn-helix domain-containing protein [bacterium]
MGYLVLTPRHLADALKSRRKEKRLTQKETALLVGLLPKTISGLEHSPEKSSVESLLKLLAAMELEMVLRPKIKRTGLPGEW